MLRIVIDTNVLVAALRSRNGASFRLLSLLPEGLFRPCVSVSLVLEYEDALKRELPATGLTAQDVDDVLDYLCQVAEQRAIYFLWRPVLRDPKDDFLLELAVEAECRYLVTHNLRDFRGSERFGVEPLTPAALLQLIEGKP